MLLYSAKRVLSLAIIILLFLSTKVWKSIFIRFLKPWVRRILLKLYLFIISRGIILAKQIVGFLCSLRFKHCCISWWIHMKILGTACINQTILTRKNLLKITLTLVVAVLQYFTFLYWRIPHKCITTLLFELLSLPLDLIREIIMRRLFVKLISARSSTWEIFSRTDVNVVTHS